MAYEMRVCMRVETVKKSCDFIYVQIIFIPLKQKKLDRFIKDSNFDVGTM